MSICSGTARRAGRSRGPPRDAAALYHHSPHTLVFGGWDSTGPRGARGSKYERAITSEIVALDIEHGQPDRVPHRPGGIELQRRPAVPGPGRTPGR